MTINEVQDIIIADFASFEDWMDKYNVLIDMGKELPVIDPKFQNQGFSY